MLSETILAEPIVFNQIPREASLIKDPLLILVVLFGLIVLTEILVRKTFCRHFGTALLVIIITAIAANLRIIPTNATDAPVYDVIFVYVAPIGIFFLLLEVNLRDILKAGIPMLIVFLSGSLGIFLGAVIAMFLVNGSENIGELYNVIGGMFVGTYTGGSINFNAVALEHRMMDNATLYAGTTAVDSIITSFWMILTLSLPKILLKFYPKEARKEESQYVDIEDISPESDESERISPFNLAILLSMGILTLWLSEVLAQGFAQWGINIPSILILTTLALAIAQIPATRKLPGKRVLGVFALYLFLSVIGAYCDLAALVRIGGLGVTLLIFASILVIIHGLITVGVGYIFKIDPDTVAIASQANIGGSTSAFALAKSFKRNDLILPAILAGALGNGLGTYLGFLTVGIL